MERDLFCQGFVNDLCWSLGISEEQLTIGTLAAGSVIVPFTLSAPQEADLESIYAELMSQIDRPNSKLRSGAITGAANPVRSVVMMKRAELGASSTAARLRIRARVN